jgi:hypothetical protein
MSASSQFPHHQIRKPSPLKKNGLTWDEPDRGMHKAAVWFLFDSEHAFFVVYAGAGIDSEKLRNHLQTSQRLGPDETSNVLEKGNRENEIVIDS